MFSKTVKILFGILAVILMIIPAAAGAEEDSNLLFNASFDFVDEEGVPEGWFTDAYILETGYTGYSILSEDVLGERKSVLYIQNYALNDARLAQTVEVQPETMYHFSALIRAEGINEGHGANLSIEGIYAFSEEIYDTNGEWQKIDWYGETGPDQDEVTLFLRLGGYSGESMGKAWFTDVMLEETDELPEDVIADRWFKLNQPAVYEDDEEEDSGNPAWPWLLLISIFYATAALCIMTWVRHHSAAPLAESGTAVRETAVCIALMAAFLLRVVISYHVEGYLVDVNCFTSWGYTMAAAGAGQFYTTVSFCDYPPAYLLILGINARLIQAFSLSSEWIRVVYRLFPSLCDILGCAVLFQYAKKQEKTNSLYAAVFVILLAFNPVSILNSAAWGQMDSVLCMLILLVAVWAAERKWILALPCYMLAVLVKPQALMLGPLGLTAMICSWKKDREDIRKILIGLACSVITGLIIILSFTGEQDAGWIIRLYENTLSSYPYATINTANLFYLLGDNWSPIESDASIWALAILAVFCGLYAFLWKKKASKRLKAWKTEFCGMLLFGVWFIVCAAAKASWIYAGTASMALAFVIVLSMYIRKRDIRFLPYAGAMLFVLLYVFGIKMHERYVFPAFLLLGLAWVMHRDRRILHVGLALSVCVFLNEGIVLDNSIRLGSSMGHLNADTAWLAGIISIINIASALYAVWIGLACTLGEEAPEQCGPGFSFLTIQKADGVHSPLNYHPDAALHWKPLDTALLAAITVVYAAVSLLTLGSTKAPQTAWISSGYDEQVILDLGEEHPEAYMLYFAQVSMYDFSVAESEDAENWSEEIWAQMNQQQCWKWKYVTKSAENASGERQYYNSGYDDLIRFSQRYVRITAHQVSLKLNEILFKTDDGSILPVSVYQRIGGNEESELYSDPNALTDEQNTLEGLPLLFTDPGETDPNQPSWWNSSYFDEIYHARTAYEFIQRSVPYETTHPPLGKVLISWGIALFGMTPFGWRLAGAIAGILMIPGMYLLGKQLTKKTYAGVFCAALIALDCQHLTQTQIATIDSFPVLFIIFAFFFMLRFVQTDLMRTRRIKVLLTLAASGFFMGLSIASKWIGIYAGAGLAVLFFWHCARQILICRNAAKMAEEEELSSEQIEQLQPYLAASDQDLNPAVPIVIQLCLWCLLFFVLQPLCIYLVSYIPYMAYNRSIHSTGDFLKAVWNSQINIFKYHSQKNLGMDHPFYSPWWEWPIIGKPMYYASESYELDVGLYHTIFCFGNPVIWLSGLAGLIGCAFNWVQGKRYQITGSPHRWHWIRKDYQQAAAFILIGFLAQYLPWTLVPRGTYIYHYFASIPFLILSLAFTFQMLLHRERRALIALLTVFTVLAAISFVIFFPYASGIMAPEQWLKIGSGILRIWY